MALSKDWVKMKDHSKPEYIEGVDAFLNFAFSNIKEGDDTTTIRCPCDNCRNLVFKRRHEVRLHLLSSRMYEHYKTWDLHGERADHHDNLNAYDDLDLHEKDPDDSEMDMLKDACGIPGMDFDVTQRNFSDESTFEEPRGKAAKFYRLLDAYREPLSTSSDTKMSKLSYIVKLLHLKVLNNWSDSSFDSLLKVQSQAMGTSLPESYYEARKLITDLGLDCIKIDACRNDCMLYWKGDNQLDKCFTCGSPRYRTMGDRRSKCKKVPFKVLRYFPLKSRLQRLYMSRKTAKDMRWHKEERVDDEVMRHPADSDAWKEFDKENIFFACDARNVRLGLACDGFQPFKDSQYTICPVVIIPYNLPPWVCMKPHSILLTLLIPGPTSPGRNLDVYLQPLIEELKELWEVGIDTYDAYSKTHFNMHAMLLWTISDFPAYTDLSGWSTKGNYACPPCHKHTRRTSLKNKGGYLGHRRWLPRQHKWRKDKVSFNGEIERGSAPTPLTGDEVLNDYSKFEQEKFGKIIGKKRKWDSLNSLYGWRKKSIFFELPYWKELKIRHNIDVMHTEKNVSENILGTVMNIKGKSKDTMKARIDLLNMGIREELHPVVDGDKIRVPVACYTLNASAKAVVCKMFEGIKSPDGYMSNISRCIKDNGKKISGLKSHDHHIYIEQLLPLAVRGFLPKAVYEPLADLSQFFRNLCSKNITKKELEALQSKIPYTLCKLEMIFPPAFFDIMVHLVIHLADEANIAGPVRYRWMYPIERYLRTLKKYIRNRAQPEGCIAEGYLADECLTFCSRYMDDIDTKFNRKGRNDDEVEPEVTRECNLEIFKPIGRHLGKGAPVHLSPEECNEIHTYVLLNCDELLDFIKEHKQEVERENPRNVERRHRMQFATWINDRVCQLYGDGRISEEVYNLVSFPSREVRRYNGYVVNGFRFHTRDRCENRKTQNSGVLVRGDDLSDKEYYGVIRDIYEMKYPGEHRVFVFKCDWFDVLHHGRGIKLDDYGVISVNKRLSLKTDEVYVLESQVEQVFYVQDPRNEDWQFVIKTQPRDLFDMPNDDDGEVFQSMDAYQQVDVAADAECNIVHLHDDFRIDSLATNEFVVEREPSTVKMVKAAIEKYKLDDDFINDGDIEVYEDQSEEEEEELYSDDSD